MMAQAYLLLPIASIAEAGGPMKVIPASVHFFAKCGFSLSFTSLAKHSITVDSCVSYKAVARMYSLAALLFGNLYYPVPIKVCGRITEVNSKRRTEGML